MISFCVFLFSFDYEEIIIDFTCSWKSVLVKFDLYVREESDGSVLKRCRIVSFVYVFMFSVMEMIVVLGFGVVFFVFL